MAMWQYSRDNGLQRSSGVFIRCLSLAMLVLSSPSRLAAAAPNKSAAWLQDKDIAKDIAEVEDGKFRCPEKLSNLNERKQEVEAFLTWTRRRHPRWTLEQIMTFRIAVLTKQGCSETIANIKAQPNIATP